MARKSDNESAPPKTAAALKSLRTTIDKLDLQILDLVNKRAALAAEIGKVKNDHGTEVFSPAREEEVYANVLEGNCNGITGTQQDRSDSTPPAHVLRNLNVHDNVVNGGGSSGVVEDNGANLNSRGITFVRNSFGGGHDFCGTTC